MLHCDELLGYLDARRTCERSPYGTRVATHCIYPSSDPVYVHVARWGDKEFRVSDGGEAARCALQHGRDPVAVMAGLKSAGDRFSLEIESEELIARVPTSDWLPNAVSAVASGAAFAANSAIDYMQKARQKSFKEEVGEHLRRYVPENLLAHGYEMRGRSGKVWEIDFAITVPDLPILIKAVTPNHVSIAATYTALSDVMTGANRRISVFSKRPDEDDAALLRQVSELMPLTAVSRLTPEQMA